MGKKRTLDIIIACLLTAALILNQEYMQQTMIKYGVLVVNSIMLMIFVIIAFHDKEDGTLIKARVKKGKVTRLVLLSEENTSLAEWDIYEKSSLIVGKDRKNSNADINLSQSAYAGLIDYEHAVLNYTAENWYIEDLESKNGVCIQKAEDGRKYKLSSGQPCKIEKGDVLYIGLARLAVQ